MYIFVFGVVGTIITFSVVAPLTYIVNNNNMFKLSFAQNIINSKNISDEIHNFNETIINHNLNKDSNSSNENLLQNTNDLFNDKTNQLINNNDTADSYNTDEGHILTFSLKEILMFSAVISATDSVAALTFIREDTEPKLFALLFGEGVINDAVCIVLYRIIRDFFASDTAGKIIILAILSFFW